MAKTALPNWPRMMKRDTAAQYCDMSIAEFERAIASGVIPMPVRFGDRDRWSREQIDAWIARAEGDAPKDWRANAPIYAR
nr:hypothetical protein [Sphingomonas laterariae]